MVEGGGAMVEEGGAMVEGGGAGGASAHLPALPAPDWQLLVAVHALITAPWCPVQVPAPRQCAIIVS